MLAISKMFSCAFKALLFRCVGCSFDHSCNFYLPGNGFPAQNSHPSMPAICHEINCDDHERGHDYDCICICIRYSKLCSHSDRLVKGKITLHLIRSSFRLERHSVHLSKSVIEQIFWRQFFHSLLFSDKCFIFAFFFLGQGIDSKISFS